MPGRDDYFGRNSEYDAYERHRRELDDRGRGSEDRSFDRSGQQDRWGQDRNRGSDQWQNRGSAQEDWRSDRSGSRYDQDRTHYSRGGRPDWQDRDWQGGSPGLSQGYEDDDRRMRERHERNLGQRGSYGGQGGSRDFRQGRSDQFGYSGQEYGMEARGGGRGAGEFGRTPEPVQRVTDGDDDPSWRDRFGDDGRPHPRFSDDDRDHRDRHEHRGWFGRQHHDDDHDDHRGRGGMFGGRDERSSWFRRDDDDRERRFAGRTDDHDHTRWGDDGGHRGRSVDPFEAAASRRRQDEMRRRGEEDRRRHADLDRQERGYRSTEGRWPWDRDW